MRTAYFDCISGASGDMILGALIDTGAPLNVLKKELKKIIIKGYSISSKRVLKNGIAATKVDIKTKEKNPKRKFPEIMSIIKKSGLKESVKKRSLRVFEKIVAAESRIHNKKESDVFLHEVSGIDSIIDVVGAFILLDYLKIDKIYCSELRLGKGFVKFSHGTYPVPSPATLEIVKAKPVVFTETGSELTTPTGAAILSSIAEFQKPRITVGSIGYGAGSRELKTPNVIRVIIGETDNREKYDDSVDLIETNIDDMNPELYDHAMKKLFEKGALDVFLQSIMMKKNRPGIKLSVISPLEKTKQMVSILFRETTTRGVRLSRADRYKLDFKIKEIKTKFGKIKVKINKRKNNTVSITPEYESCRKAALKHDVPLRKVYEEVERKN